jgi:hypothetical protein
VNEQILKSLMATWMVSLSCVVIQPSPANAQTIVSTEASNGSVELGNVSDADAKEPVAAEPTADVASAAPTTEPATAEVPKDPREQYREKVMKEPEGQPLSATSAVSRRYKKMDKATYQATMLEPAAQTAPAQQGGGSATN